jgi:hypothetical protein
MVLTTLAVGVVALPTVVTDLYNTQDVWNRGRGAGFRWTVLLSPGEVEGLDWIKRATPKNARVQVEPYSRGRDTWTYIPAFGERRMAAGLPIGMIPLAKYEKASETIRRIYQAETAQDAHTQASAACVDYVVIGAPERQAYPAIQPLVAAAPHLFPPAFSNDALSVYAIAGSWERPECPH